MKVYLRDRLVLFLHDYYEQLYRASGYGVLVLLTPTGPQWACQSRGFMVLLVVSNEQGHTAPAYQVPASYATEQDARLAMQSFSTTLGMPTSRTVQLHTLAKTRLV